MRYWFPGADPDASATAQRIAEIERHWSQHAFGDWGVESASDGELIGFAGLHHIADVDEVNIGYVLRRDHWGQGLGYEIARRLLAFAFETLALREVVAVVDPANIASVRLAAKCGLAQRRRLTWMGCDRLQFGLTRGEWLS
jgi:RimJ/RimL family protein N-acetyltransferase